MNSKLLIFIFAIALSLTSICEQEGIGAEKLDTCWTLVNPHIPSRGLFNPDSVMVDSCLSNIDSNNIIFFKYLYAKQWFYFVIPYEAFYIPPTDTIVPESYYTKTWRDIDSNFHVLRDSLSSLEDKFGPFILKKYSIGRDDTLFGGKSSAFKIIFDKYVNIDSVEKAINKIDSSVGGYYLSRFGIDYGTIVNEVNKNIPIINIFPNPVTNTLTINIPIEKPGALSVSILDVMGNRLFNLEPRQINYVGIQNINIDNLHLDDGLYFCIMKLNDAVISKKIVVMK